MYFARWGQDLVVVDAERSVHMITDHLYPGVLEQAELLHTDFPSAE